MRRFSSVLGLFLATLLGAQAPAPDPSWGRQTPNFWTLEQRDVGFRAMEKVYPTKTVPVGYSVHVFPKGKPLVLNLNVREYMKAERASGLIVVHKDAIRLEEYADNFGASGHWESFSIAKSITSTLVGAAVADGFIQSIDDKVSKYVKGLKDSAYDDVTIRQLLTMTSGVKWNENYEDPSSDAVRLRLHKPEPGADVTVSYMRQLPRAFPPGEKFAYKTGEAELTGVLVSQATGKPLSRYLAEKIWIPYGMEAPAYWELNESGAEMGGCCLSANVRDYARFGQFILDGGRAGGRPVLPADWLGRATAKQVDIGAQGRGYGYLWWTNDDGSFQAVGIYGQSIFIDPKRQLAIATTADWPAASDRALGTARAKFFKAVQAAVDAGN